MATVHDLILVLQTFFSPQHPLRLCLLILTIISSFHPILLLHRNQQQHGRNIAETGWKKILLEMMSKSAVGEIDEQDIETLTRDVYGDLDALAELLSIDGKPLSKEPPILLISAHMNCPRCSVHGETHPLHKSPEDPRLVRILTSSLNWKTAYDIVAYCRKCSARFYADRYTYHDQVADSRMQCLDYDAKYLRISIHGLWVERRIAEMQEYAIDLSHTGWETFANWVNRPNRNKKTHLTVKQSKRIYLEHFSRRLLVAHRKDAQFAIESDPSSNALALAVRAVLGRDGGILSQNMQHNCRDCTHHKRSPEDLVREGLIVGNQASDAVAEQEDDGDIGRAAGDDGDEQMEGIPAGLAAELPRQPPAQDGELVGFVRMAVADGKTLGHRICAIMGCKNPLVNYKNGRFCEDHLPESSKCGLVACNENVAEGELTCGDQSHRNWYQKYITRFKRLTFPGVKRVIRRQQEAALAAESSDPVAVASRNRPVLSVDLPSLGETTGPKVAHTFRARKLYCILTVQWACGCPVAWGKCYTAESVSDMLEIIDKVWSAFRHLQPEFLVYDNSCNLLRHIVTQNPLSHWVVHTKLIVDAWHYIGHKSTDLLCRTRCNPAPTDGSQPDLIKIATDDAGRKHTVRAFNTETAEQFNSWLNGFEPHTRQMTDFMFDFFIHGLMMLYSETVRERIVKKKRNLPERFWERRVGDEYNSDPSDLEADSDAISQEE